MGISNLNKGKRFAFQYDSKGISYYNLNKVVELFGLSKTFILRAAHINRGGKYGATATFIVSDNDTVFGINAPSHMVGSVEDILNNNDYIDQIDNGNAGVKVYAYTDRDGATRYSLEYIDIK